VAILLMVRIILFPGSYAYATHDLRANFDVDETNSYGCVLATLPMCFVVHFGNHYKIGFRMTREERSVIGR
jgi:hypothetical protein